MDKAGRIWILERSGNAVRVVEDGKIRTVAGTGEKARRSALKQMLQTFIDGSTEAAVAALLDLSRPKLSAPELERLSRMIDEAKKEGR